MGFDIVARNEDEPVVENKSAEIEKLTSFNGGFLMQLISGVLGLAGQIIGGAVTAVVGGVKIIADGVKQLVGGIAKAIMGEGASHNEITGAVDERLGPLDSAITENAKHFKELSDRADVLGEQQTETRKAAEDAVEKAEGSIKHTDSLIAKRVQAEKLIAADVAEANRKAGNAQKSADGKSTNHYGSGVPASPKDGDVWFKPVSGGTQIMVREAGKWVNRTDTAALDKALEDNKKAVADAAEGVKQLREVDLVKLRGSLASEAQERERALAGLGVELESANRELASLGTARPGNVWPDPHFKDPCWVGNSDRWINPNNNGGELTFRANGKQIGMYYQPKGKYDKGLMLERGAKYLLTATVWRDKNLPDKTTISVHMRQNGKWIAVVGRLPTGPAGVSVESVILDIPTSIGGGGSTLGFFIEKDVKQGTVSIWDVQIVRAADDAMIIDGAVTAAKVHAGAIDTKHLAADAVTAEKIKAGEITGDKLKADTITGREVKAGTINADQLKVDNGFIKTAMIGDGQITSAKIANLDAGKITTGALDGKLIKADTITVNQLRANSIVPIGGSLIHHEPTAKNPTIPEPIWWQVCDQELEASYSGWPRPEGHPWRMYSKAARRYAYQAPPKRLVKVQPGQKYRLQFWCRATVANTRMSIEIRDQNGKFAVKSGSVNGTVNKGNYKTAKEAKQPWPVTDFSDSSASGYLVGFFTVPTETTKVVSTIEFKEGVEYVYLDVFRFNLLDGARGNLWIAGLSLELDIPDQAAVDAAQNTAIEAAREAAAANTQFNKQQEEINSLTQERLWQHQDMIELLDIRAPKTYGWDVYNNKYDTRIPWTSETEREKYTPPHEWRQDEPDPQWRDVPLKGYRMTSPFFDMYRRGDRVWIGFKGDVQGMFDIEINWTNGAIDNWTLPMQGAKSRVYRLEGGAGHIYMRSVQVTVYPTSLRRKVNLTLRNGAWQSPSDTNKLIRSQNAKFVRFKNGVKCNRSITLRSDGGVKRTYSPGTILWSEQFYAEDQPRSSSSVVYEFTEIDDVDVQYTVPNSAPSATDKTSNYFNARR